HHVGIGDHAKVAMAGFARVDIEGGGAGGGERGGDLAGDVAGLAHARADHAAAAGQQERAGAREVAVDARGDRRKAPAFDLEYPPAAGREVGRAGGAGWRVAAAWHFRAGSFSVRLTRSSYAD